MTVTRTNLLHQLFVSLVVLITIAVTVIPVGVASWVAERRAVEKSHEELMSYAQRALVRAELVVADARDALAQMKAVKTPVCSDEYLASMRRVSIAHRYVQEIIALRGDGIISCSALLGRMDHQVTLGPPTWDGKTFRFWTSARDLEQTGKPMLVLADNQNAVLLDPDSLVDVISETRAALGVVGTKSGKVIATWNHLSPQRVLEVYNTPGTELLDGNYYVTVRSQTLPLAVVAGEQAVSMASSWYATLKFWVPIGLLLGCLLAGGMLLVLRSRFSLVGQLRDAIRRKVMTVHYQPIVDLNTRRCVGAEALVRWPQTRGSMIRPDLFVPLAEENGLIQPLTDLVLEIICREMATVLQLRTDLYVSINLSAVDLSCDRFLKVLQRQLTVAGIEPASINIEATERGFMHAETAKEIIQSLRMAGHQVLIDDFGTGYSGLSYLQQFKVDVLKIDKSFVDTVGTEAATASVAPHIVQIGHSLELKLIAEGIESEAQATWLQERGVQCGQGWLFAKAMPANEFLAFLAAERTLVHPG